MTYYIAFHKEGLKSYCLKWNKVNTRILHKTLTTPHYILGLNVFDIMT
jgi:hypothetical protein